jgi:hypothetical protein
MTTLTRGIGSIEDEARNAADGGAHMDLDTTTEL